MSARPRTTSVLEHEWLYDDLPITEFRNITPPPPYINEHR